jgi:aerobic-type carbon monoxide dehydrogenase small subunit (CoxS/CutS family)
MNRIDFEITLNGEKITVQTDPAKRLLDMLREDLHMTGTKEGCSVGECGACTVILNGKTVNSCMVLVGQLQNAEIITIEGIKGENGSLHPLQDAFIESGAVQCGFCTPGMIVSAYALLQVKPIPTVEEIKKAVSGNLCRCTGYKQIIEAVNIAIDRDTK